MKLLMHVCCGPCAMYPSDSLAEKSIEFDALFYNPNIHPREEYEKRLENAKLFAEIKNVKLHIIDEYDEKPWQLLKDKKEKRCSMCYHRRIKGAFEFAKENGYSHITSTLFVSPYQNHELMKEIFLKYEKQYGVIFFYEDFRVGFYEGNREAKANSLYTQRYCGCGPSYLESDIILKKLRKKQDNRK